MGSLPPVPTSVEPLQQVLRDDAVKPPLLSADATVRSPLWREDWLSGENALLELAGWEGECRTRGKERHEWPGREKGEDPPVLEEKVAGYERLTTKDRKRWRGLHNQWPHVASAITTAQRQNLVASTSQFVWDGTLDGTGDSRNVFYDVGLKGSEVSRSGLKKVMKLVEAGEITALAVRNLDRLARFDSNSFMRRVLDGLSVFVCQAYSAHSHFKVLATPCE